MKRMFIFFILLVVPLSVYAQRSRGGGDWQLSASVGANIASMDSEMQAGNTNLEDYSGRVGAESHFSGYIRVSQKATPTAGLGI